MKVYMDSLTKKLTGGFPESKLKEYVSKQLDFAGYAGIVKGYATEQLWAALWDIQKTLRNADAVDRERMGAGAGADYSSEGGYYRDQASVIRQEIFRREGSDALRQAPAGTMDI